MKNRLAFLICENLEREARSVLKEYEDVHLSLFASHCNLPFVDWSNIEKRVEECKEKSGQIYLLCGPTALQVEDIQKERLKSGLCKMDQCFELLVTKRMLESYLRKGAYVLTPGWLSRWRHYIKRWGFDRERAREFFGESTKKLLLLDTGMYSDSHIHLEEFADFLNLPFESIEVGLDFFRLLLSKLIVEWRCGIEKQNYLNLLQRANKEASVYAMAFELINRLTANKGEESVIENIFEIFTMLMGPGSLAFLPVVRNAPGVIRSRPKVQESGSDLIEKLFSLKGEYCWSEDGKGFYLAIPRGGEMLGILKVDGLAFPEHKEHYVNMSLTIAKVCGLAISNARAYEQLGTTIDSLSREVRERKRIQKELQSKNRELGDFASNVSHNMKNSIIVIRRMLEFARKDPGKVIEKSGLLIRSADDLINYVERLLELARAGKVIAEKCKIPIEPFAESIFNRLKPIEIDAGIAFQESFPDILCDPLGLEQVLLNLIGNSFQYRDPEKRKLLIELGYRLTDEYIEVLYRDNGMGLDEGKGEHIFDLGYTSNLRDHLGFGLAITKRIVEAHGGCIQARSEGKGCGIEFIITLPAQDPS